MSCKQAPVCFGKCSHVGVPVRFVRRADVVQRCFHFLCLLKVPFKTIGKILFNSNRSDIFSCKIKRSHVCERSAERNKGCYWTQFL